LGRRRESRVKATPPRAVREKTMQESVFSVSLEIIAAVLAAIVFAIDCLRREADATVRVPVSKHPRQF
jgi:hypothetical protein